MKRYAGSLLVGLSGILLSGCPIYPSEIECYDNFDCPTGYFCDDSSICVRPPSGGSGGGTAGTGGTPANPSCDGPEDCDINETCGEDGTCHTGDCYFSGCVDGYECILDGYQYVCVPIGSGGTGGGGSGGGTGGTGGEDGGVAGAAGSGGVAGSAGSAGAAGAAGEAAAPIYCGNPADCAPGQVCAENGQCVDGTCTEHGCVNGYVCDGGGDAGAPTCVPENSASCILDDDCSSLGSGFKCLNGMCTAPADQCTDGTQCPDPVNQSCVDGKCIASCDDPSDCPDGYTCDTALGVCTQPSTACTITQDCGDPGLVCVAGACVDKCEPDDVCPTGYVCVANGCVPNEEPVFTCGTEGVQDVCSIGSICLHHSCYIACTPDPDSCTGNPPDLDKCKSVTTSSGSYDVCGSSSNLGEECDPTGNDCAAGEICIDGFCL